MWSAVVVVMLGYIVGFYFQRRDLDRIDRGINRGRIDDLRDAMNQRFGAVEARFSDLNAKMDARFSDMKDFVKLELSRLEDRIDRLEHPVAKP